MGIRSLSLVTALCVSLLLPGAALASSFTDFANGVKTMTGAAKDVNEINKDNKQPQAQKAKSAPKKSKNTKKAPAPKAETRVRGG